MGFSGQFALRKFRPANGSDGSTATVCNVRLLPLILQQRRYSGPGGTTHFVPELSRSGGIDTAS